MECTKYIVRVGDEFLTTGSMEMQHKPPLSPNLSSAKLFTTARQAQDKLTKIQTAKVCRQHFLDVETAILPVEVVPKSVPKLGKTIHRSTYRMVLTVTLDVEDDEDAESELLALRDTKPELGRAHGWLDRSPRVRVVDVERTS